MESKSLGFIGGGRITKIFLQAFANKQIDFSLVVVCDNNTEILKALKNQFPKIQITSSCKKAAEQEIVFIALHPPAIMGIVEQIKESVSKSTQVISLAPKINIEKIGATLPTKNIVRMIPNATSFINQGYNQVCFSDEYSSAKKQSLFELLSVLGKTFEVEESKLEAYALVSAMLPTYFWFQWNEIQNQGLEMGLNEVESKDAVQETLLAAIKLIYDSGLSYEEVIDLIPIKPIGEHEAQISGIYQTKLMGLFQKIKP